MTRKFKAVVAIANTLDSHGDMFSAESIKSLVDNCKDIPVTINFSHIEHGRISSASIEDDRVVAYGYLCDSSEIKDILSNHKLYAALGFRFKTGDPEFLETVNGIRVIKKIDQVFSIGLVLKHSDPNIPLIELE